MSDVKTNGLGSLKSALSTVQRNATTAINQAKTDFSSHTNALKNSLDALDTTGKQVAGTPSVRTLAQLSTVDTAARNLHSAVSSKCG